MKSYVLIGLLTVIWLALMANIIWEGTDGTWMVEDAEKIGQLEVAKYTNQIIVVAVVNNNAELCLYENVSNDDWQLVFEIDAIIGKNGLRKTKEGDGKTPVGVFIIKDVFGILDNPGTKIEYTKVDESYYWVDDSSSKYYNRLVSTDLVRADWLSAEHIVEYKESYNYVLATSYNSECISGVGSAVFLHCTSNDMETTAGCVAIPEVYMRNILRHLQNNCVLIIDEKENILNY